MDGVVAVHACLEFFAQLVRFDGGLGPGSCSLDLMAYGTAVDGRSQ